MQKSTRSALRVQLVTAAIALTAGIVASMALAHAGDWLAEEFDDAAIALHYFVWQFITTLLLVAFAISLYAFRLWNRTIFGVGELSIGVFVVWNIVGELAGHANTGVWLTILTGSTFLIIRGCDNIHQGIEAGRIANQKLAVAAT